MSEQLWAYQTSLEAEMDREGMSDEPNNYTLEDLENQVVELFTERSALREKLTEKDARIAELEAACQEWNTEVVRYQDRIALLEKSNTAMKEAHEHILDYWNRDENENAMSDALGHIIETSEEALRAAGI